MKYPRTRTDGSAREEALKRRNAAARQVWGTGPKPEPAPEPDSGQPAEQTADEKPGA